MAAKKTTARRTTTARKPATRKATTARKPAAKKTTAKKTTTRARTTRTEEKPRGMTVQEAGRKGGLIGGRKGGETVKAERGVEFYQEIGRKGGQKVRELIEAGRAAMASRRSSRR